MQVLHKNFNVIICKQGLLDEIYLIIDQKILIPLDKTFIHYLKRLNYF
jgi:hypothetical protein